MELIHSLSFVLNVTVVILGSVMKLPQVVKLYRSKSSEGISIWGSFLELACFMTGSGYGYSFAYPIHAYAENIFLTLQGFSIIYLAIVFGKETGTVAISIFVLFICFYITTILSLVPIIVFQVLMAVILPVMAAGKVIQIRSVIAIRSAGSVSVMSWAIGTYICAARVFSTLVLTPGDIQVLLNYAVGLFLNIIMMSLLLYYGQPKKKELKE